MASISTVSSLSTPWITSKSTQQSRNTSASLTLLTGRSSVSVNVVTHKPATRPALLYCSFVSSSSSLSFPSAFSGRPCISCSCWGMIRGLKINLNLKSCISLQPQSVIELRKGGYFPKIQPQ